MEECGPDKWQADAAAGTCPHCNKSFGFLKKRHHCRFCGRVVCADCSKESVVASSTNKGTFPRACVACEQKSKRPVAPVVAPTKVQQKAAAPATPNNVAKAAPPQPAAPAKASAPLPKPAHVDPATPTAPPKERLAEAPSSPSLREPAENKEEAALGAALAHRLEQQGRVMGAIKRADKAASGLHEKLETIQSVLEVGAQFFSHIPVIGEPLEKVTGLIGKVFKIAKAPMANAKLIIALFDRIAALSVPLREDFHKLHTSGAVPTTSTLLEALSDILDEAFELVQQFIGDPDKPLSFLSAFNPKNWKQKSEDSFAEIHRKIDSALLSRSYEIGVKAPTMDEIKSVMAKERVRLESTVGAVQRGVDRLRQGQEIIGDQLNRLNDRITELQQDSQFRQAGLKWKTLAEPEKLVVMEEKVVAEGSQFIVVEGRYCGEPVAVKIVKKEVLLSNGLEELFTEACFLSAYQHDNMIAFHGVHRARGQVMLVEELGGASLDDALTSLDQPMEKSAALRVLHDVVKAVSFLHQRGVMHKDLCPRNILLCSQSLDGAEVAAKLCSFGQAKRQADGSGLLAAAKGNIRYRAPETLHETLSRHASLASDCYSIGVLAWQLLTGAVPWAGLSDGEVAARVLRGDRLDCGIFGNDALGADIATLLDDSAYRPDIDVTHEMVLEWQNAHNGAPSSPLAPPPLPCKAEFRHFNRQQLCQFLSRAYPPPDPEEDDPLLPICRTSRVWELIERDQWDGEMLLDVTKAEFSTFFPKTSETNRLWDRIEAVRRAVVPTGRHVVVGKGRPRVPWGKEWLRMAGEDRLQWLRAWGVIASTISFVSKRTGKELLNVEAIENDLEEPTVNVPAPHKKRLLRLLSSIASKEVSCKGFATKVVCIASCREFLSELEGKVAAGEAVEDVGVVLPEIAAFSLLDEGLASQYLAVVCEAIEAPAAAAVIRGQFGASLLGIVQKYCTSPSAPVESLLLQFFAVYEAASASPYFQEAAMQISTCGLDRELLVMAPRVPKSLVTRYLPMVIFSIGANTITVETDAGAKCMNKRDVCLYLLENTTPTYRVYNALISVAEDEPIVLSDGRVVTPLFAATEYARLAGDEPHRLSVSWYVWSRLFTAAMGTNATLSVNGVDMTAAQVCTESIKIAIKDPRTHITSICGVAQRMQNLGIDALDVDGKMYTAVELLVLCIEASVGAAVDTPWEQLGAAAAVKKSGVVVFGKSYTSLQCFAEVIARRRCPTSLHYCQAAWALPDRYTTIEINKIVYTKMQLYERAVEVALSPVDLHRAWNYIGKLLTASEVVEVLGKPISKVQAFVYALEARPEERPTWWSLYNVLEKGVTTSVNGRSINERSALVEHLRLPRKTPASTDANSWKNLGALLGPKDSVVIGGEDITKHVAYAKSLELDDKNHVTWQNVYLSLSPTLPTFHFRGESLSKLQCLAKLIGVSATDEQRATNFNRVGFVLNAGETVELEGRTFTEMDCFIEAVQRNPKCSPAWANLCSQLRQKAGRTAMVNGVEVTAKEAGLRAVQCDANNAFGWWNVAALIGNPSDRLTLLDGTAVTQVECYIRYCAVPGEAPANLGIAYTAIAASLDNVRTVTVGSRELSKKDCFIRALSYRKDLSMSWTNVASALSPNTTATVGDATYTVDECLTEALKIDGADAAKRSQVFVKAAAISVANHRSPLVINKEQMSTRDLYVAALSANHNLVETWYNLGIELMKPPHGATVTIQEALVTTATAFATYLERVVPADGNKFVRINAWLHIGNTLKGIAHNATAVVSGGSVTRQQCYANAIEIETGRTASWFLVAEGLLGSETITVSGDVMDKLSVYSKALLLSTYPADKALTWLKIATDVLAQPNAPSAVSFGGQLCTAESCISQAIRLVPRHADSWWAAAELTKATGKSFTAAPGALHTTTDCYVQYVSSAAATPETAVKRSVAYAHIGHHVAAGVTIDVLGAKINRVDCFVRAAGSDPTNKSAWAALADILRPAQCVTIDGKQYTKMRCAELAK